MKKYPIRLKQPQKLPEGTVERIFGSDPKLRKLFKKLPLDMHARAIELGVALWENNEDISGIMVYSDYLSAALTKLEHITTRPIDDVFEQAQEAVDFVTETKQMFNLDSVLPDLRLRQLQLKCAIELKFAIWKGLRHAS